MDKSTADDIRVELEENRQYLVRALRAVELTTAECKEEMRLANLKADNAVALVQSLEATVFEKEGEIARIEAAGEQRIGELHRQIRDQAGLLEEQSQTMNSFQEALEAQALTIRDLREQIYSLQLRVLKNDDEADRVGSKLKRVHEDHIAALSARIDKCESSTDGAMQHMKGMHEQLRTDIRQELTEIARAVQEQDTHLQTTLRGIQVQVQAQMSNSESLTAIAIEETETRMKSGLAELRHAWEASVEESKGEVEAMFKGEMHTQQRLNAIENSMKSAASSAHIADIEAAIVEISSWVQTIGATKGEMKALEESLAKQKGIEDKLEAQMSALKDQLEMSKVVHTSAIEPFANQQQHLSDALAETSPKASDISPSQDELEIKIILPKIIEALEQLAISVENIVRHPLTPQITPRTPLESPKKSELGMKLSELEKSISMMRADISSQANKFVVLEKNVAGNLSIAQAQMEKSHEQTDSNASAASEVQFDKIKFCSADDVELMKVNVANVDTSLKALSKRVDDMSRDVSSLKLSTPVSSTQDERQSSMPNTANLDASLEALGKKVDEMSKDISSLKSSTLVLPSTQAESRTSKQDAGKVSGQVVTDEVEALKVGLGELKQEHMNLYGRVVSMERAKRALESNVHGSQSGKAGELEI